MALFSKQAAPVSGYRCQDRGTLARVAKQEYFVLEQWAKAEPAVLKEPRE